MSQSAKDVIGECPACNGTEIESNAYDHANICADCGIVITATGEPAASDVISPDTDNNAPEKADFREVCSVTNDTESRLRDAFGTIEDIADDLPTSTETRIEAADIFLAAFRKGITDSRERTCFTTACVRLASISTSQPVPTSRLIDAVDNIHSKTFHRHRHLITSGTGVEIGSPKPAEYVWFLEATNTIADRAEPVTQLLESAVETGDLVGKDPAGVAAAGAYIVDESLTQATVADAMGVSTETIRRRSKTLREVLSDD